jgi:membrane-associated phospholipid phosphatase
MHIGWTTFAALWLAAAIPRRRIGALLGGLHLALMCVTVVVTGNHYVLDIVGGFTVAGTAILIGWFLSPERLQRWSWNWRRTGKNTSATDNAPHAPNRPPVIPR